MTLKSKLVMSLVSLTMVAPLLTTGLTSVGADTVNDNSQQISTRNINVSPTNGVVTVTSNLARVFNDNLFSDGTQVVKYQSSWRTDKVAYNTATGEEFFRIAPNMWLSAYDVVFSS